MDQKLTLHVSEMHCHSCEMLIESSLKKVAHVEKVHANTRKQKVEISYSGNEINLEEIQQKIEILGYKVVEEPDVPSKETVPFFNKDPKLYTTLFLIVIGIAIIYLILKALGVSFDGLINTNSPSLGIVLLVGLTAGISSCMALVGGLILAISAKWNQENENLTPAKRIVPQLYFNAGRILGFAALGGLLGLFGSVIKLSASTMAILTIIVGLIMLLLGLNLINIFPRLSNFSIGLPKFLTKDIHSTQQKFTPKGSAFLTGLLTFFLPCGFTFAMQIYAISTGNFRMGAAVMGIFALGTLPGLLGIGTVASFVKGNFAKYFYRFVGVLVLILGVYNISNAYNIIKVKGQNISTTPIIIQTGNTEEVIHMTYTTNGLDPSTLTLQSGKKYKIIINAETDVNGCMSTILLPGLDENTQIIRNGNIITFEFMANKTGTFGFTCAMGLSHNAQVIIK